MSQARQTHKSRAVEALLAILAIATFILAGCSSPSETTTPDTAVVPPDTFVADSGSPETFADVLPDSSFDAKSCTQGSICDKPRAVCNSLVCTPCGWQISESDCDAGPPPDVGTDTFDASPESSVDSGADSGTDSGADTMDSSVDSTVVDTDTDSGFPDSGIDSGTDSGLPDTGTDSGSDTGPVDSGPPKSLTCGSWTSDTAYKSYKISGMDVEKVGGIWGTSASNIYIPSATSSHGDMAHWNGTTWNHEVLPGDTTYPSDPTQVGGIWGTDDDHLWVAARGSSVALLYSRSGGTWSKDTTAPLAAAFRSVWGSDASNRFLSGWKPGEDMVWRNTGTGWVKQTLPASTKSTAYRQLTGKIWGLDSSHVYIPGFYDDGTSPVKGFVMFFDGTSWTEAPAPTECINAYAIHGTSANELVVTCLKSDKTGIVYRVTKGMALWTAYASPSTPAPVYGSVFSKYPGASLAGGINLSWDNVMTTFDLVSAPSSKTITTAAAAVGIWAEPGTDIVHFVHGYLGGIIGGHYTSTCN